MKASISARKGARPRREVLFGDVNPGGKLPITFPHSVGDLPDFYNHKPSATIAAMRSRTRQPLFPFGYGLSYTTFKFDNLRVRAEADSDCRHGQGQRGRDQHRSSARATRSRSFTSTSASPHVTQPVMQLKGFERITLKPGEKRTVEFTVTPEMLSILNIDMHRVVEPGVFELMVGPSSDNISTVRLTVTNAAGRYAESLR